MEQCEICKKEFKRIEGLSKHISEHGLKTKEYYDKFLIKDKNEKICRFCKKNTLFHNMTGYFDTCHSKKCIKEKRKQTMNNKYGVENPSQIKDKEKEIRKKGKRKQTMINKYGVENGFQSEEIKEKIKQTNLKNLGVENPKQNEEIKEKGKQTCLKKYGVENPFQSKIIKDKIKEICFKNLGVEFAFQSEIVKEKTKLTNLKNLGVENPMQSQEVKNKNKQTCVKKYGTEYVCQSTIVKERIKQSFIKKYGVNHPMQNEIVFNKNQKYRFKDYNLPSCKIIKVQGYENYALEDLFSLGYLEEDLVIQQRKEMPEIWYKTSDNKNHRYYPDIFIPKENLIIEVKSTWTYNKYLEINLLKEKACLEAGYDFVFLIYNGKEKLI